MTFELTLNPNRPGFRFLAESGRIFVLRQNPPGKGCSCKMSMQMHEGPLK